MESYTNNTNNVKLPEENHHANGKVANRDAITKALRETTADGLLKTIQEMREDVLEHVNNRINSMMTEVMQKIETIPDKRTDVLDNTNKYLDKIQSSEEGILPDKIFLERDSLLTDLFKITHIRTVYNLFVVTLILLLLNSVAYDIMDTGTVLLGTGTIQKSFANFPLCIYIWTFMMISTLGVYPTFNVWAYQRLKLSPKSLTLKIWDYGWLLAFISYQVVFLILPTRTIINEDLSIICSIIVLSEQIRMIMKSHAFVRSVAPRFLSYKPHTETPKPNGPGFSHYLYFLFAPTLVYHDSYPRTKRIRWKVVTWNFAEVVLVMFYYAFLMECFVGRTFHKFGTQSVDWKWYVRSFLKAIVPGILCFISGFYCVLHAWMNAWAELLRFADRMFYKDWWNCTSYRAYYRTWNVVVHDWLYTYVYKDIYEIVAPRNKMLSTFAVFFVSSVVHEYILAFIFRFFYPVMLIMFGGFGYVLLFTKRASSNILMWLSFCLGNGIMFGLYAIEYYARINCRPYDNKIMDMFVPRSWSCESITA